jgi:glutamate synthase (NADPH/NADH) large chain
MVSNFERTDDASKESGLVDPADQRSNCGVGVLVNLDGARSHDIVADGFDVLENLDHRGARGAEQNTGDGAGMLLQKPHEFFREEVDGLGGADEYGVGQLFLPQSPDACDRIRTLVERAAASEGFDVVDWRRVPTDNTGLGQTALDSEPAVWQVFVEPEDDLAPDDLDTALYVLRRVIERRVREREPPGHERFYVCSLDRRTIVYKGLLTNDQLRSYYPDLSDERVRTRLVFVHARFSTNTLGAWELAHPYRQVIHNGEVNTLRGNLNWMAAREADLADPAFGADVEKIKPVTHENQSDTAIIDNVLELLVESGRSLPHAMRMLVPEAWQDVDDMDDARRDWYRYHATINEPWDGPLLVAATDGERVGAILDRNGLRPCRYYRTEDDRLVMASETGVLDADPSRVVEKGRLRPGQLFYADPDAGRIVPDEEVFERLTDETYGAWVSRNRVDLDDLVGDAPDPPDRITDVRPYQRAFGYTREDLERLVGPMATAGSDPVGAMGDDTPLSVLSERNKRLSTYFKQLFAQVSNPPLDYIREDVVTALHTHLGGQGNLLAETPEHCRQLYCDSPVLSAAEHEAVADIDANGIRAQTLDATYENGETTLADAVERLRREAVDALDEGAEILILSDRRVGPERVPIPSLLAVGGVHHHLVREGLRTRAGLVVESGQPATVHHFCTLVGYGADAVTPYLAYDSIAAMVEEGALDCDRADALATYRHAIEEGIQKVMAKMGISTLESYKGAQVFEAVGLSADFVAEYFEGTENRTDGIGVAELEADVLERHHNAFHADAGQELDDGGEFYWRRDGEFHQWNPSTIGKLQYAAQADDFDAYTEFAGMINDQHERLQTLRGLLELDTDGRDSVPLEEVEPVEDVVERFFTASMSFGSLSKEAHETLAIAMNRVGGTACSGEGGEPVERFGTERECGNKQVASGRFGVTATYLEHADHLGIKMAQGSKPGEGGHLPGEKVNEIIAETRNTTPGVPLISPPPHHDIYSIEDLAQLIHDLKCASPDADIHVKLVSEAGVGIIAAGVAKAKADAVLISGHSGGTGASPKSSIKHAGLPWELGIAEANQVLRENGLRSRIRMRVDGGMKTGRDVVVAALLGAEEYGFGTAPLVTCGCIMLRKCHCNTCSVGVATQDPDLREQFPGKPEYVVNYMTHIAQEVREYMADLGVRSMDDLIGRVDLLDQRAVDHPRARHVDLSGLLREVETGARRQTTRQNHGLDEKLDRDLLSRAAPALASGETVELERQITNRDRTVGAMLSSHVAGAYGEDGLPDDTVTVRFAGSAGQSFGAFLASGVTLTLDGDANDYVGKGLSGGKLVIRTPAAAGYAAAENVVIGNVALYGGTAGEAYVNGLAGERFGVRNSGVKAVVEGVGDHGCEYMTGGAVVVLGETGRNFAAGMSGGEAYVLDERGDFPSKVNGEMVHLESLAERDRRLVKRMVENHYRYTGSSRAREVLDDWDDAVEQFVKVMPDAFAEALAERLADGEDPRASPPPEPDAAAAARVMTDD